MESRKQLFEKAINFISEAETGNLNYDEVKHLREKILSVKCTIEAIEDHEIELNCLYDDLAHLLQH